MKSFKNYWLLWKNFSWSDCDWIIPENDQIRRGSFINQSLHFKAQNNSPFSSFKKKLDSGTSNSPEGGSQSHNLCNGYMWSRWEIHGLWHRAPSFNDLADILPALWMELGRRCLGNRVQAPFQVSNFWKGSYLIQFDPHILVEVFLLNLSKPREGHPMTHMLVTKRTYPP